MTDHVSEYVRKAAEKAKSSPSPLREPGKRWRNRWRVIHPYNSRQFGRMTIAGEEYWGRFIWPSKDAAETRAAENIRDWIARCGRPICELVGTFPIEGDNQ